MFPTELYRFFQLIEKGAKLSYNIYRNKLNTINKFIEVNLTQLY